MAQRIVCIECGAESDAIPAGFRYEDPSAGWIQDPAAAELVGYCQPCQELIARLLGTEIVSRS